ncbi:MAG: hypothetical protein ACE5I0_07530 [Candidatus Binatia bacterium]
MSVVDSPIKVALGCIILVNPVPRAYVRGVLSFDLVFDPKVLDSEARTRRAQTRGEVTFGPSSARGLDGWYGVNHKHAATWLQGWPEDFQ